MGSAIKREADLLPGAGGVWYRDIQVIRPECAVLVDLNVGDVAGECRYLDPKLEGIVCVLAYGAAICLIKVLKIGRTDLFYRPRSVLGVSIDARELRFQCPVSGIGFE